jgi:hypothetical protein
MKLTPKGLNVRTADKPVLVNVTWAHTFFGFFETFCEYAPRTKPHKSRHRPTASGRLLVAGRPWAANLWTATSGRRTVGDGRGLVSRQRPGPDR